MCYQDYISLITALVAIVALVWQMRQSNKQSKMHTYLTYTQRYQDILVNLPIEVESSSFKPSSDPQEQEKTLRWLRAYFDLCSEEYLLHNEKLVDDNVWALWKGGISDSLKKPAFQWAWKEIQRNNYYDSKFSSFICDMMK